MPNTYTQIHIQFVFAVKYRQGLIKKEWKNDLFKYITGIIQNQGHKLLAINGVEDHIHLLVGLRPKQSISDLMQDVKGASSKWINDNKFTFGRFEWQEGYGAFSYSSSELKSVIEYIKKQEEHHKIKSFREEYVAFLKYFKVDYDEKYIFNEPVEL